MSENRSFSLAKLQESILREYKRGAFGEETPHYDIESIYYSDIPKELPEAISAPFARSIVLYNYSFFEMLTFAVFEFLFHSPAALRKTVVDKIKSCICSQEFMFGSNYIKGLLVKGLRSVTDLGERTTKPIAQILLKNDAMNAFTEFWKEVIEEQTGGELKHSQVTEHDSYQFVANFLGINFQLFWKRENGYEEETVRAQTPLSDDRVAIAVFERTLIESIITKVLEEGTPRDDSERGYVILLRESAKPTPNAVTDKNAELAELRLRACAVTKKGSELLGRFRQFYRQMRAGVE